MFDAYFGGICINREDRAENRDAAGRPEVKTPLKTAYGLFHGRMGGEASGDTPVADFSSEGPFMHEHPYSWANARMFANVNHLKPVRRAVTTAVALKPGPWSCCFYTTLGMT